jgi:hypothetical protein
VNSGEFNAFVGYECGKNSTSGSYDTFIGFQAGLNSVSSSYTVFIGAQCGAQNVNGSEVVGIGFKALEQSKDANQATAIGAYALRENISGTGSVGVGYRVGERMLDGRYNTLLGTEAAQNMRTGDYNTIQGYQAGRAAFAINENAYFGAFSGYSNSSGTGNCLFGYKSGYALQDGSFNVAIGAYAMYSGSNVNSNVAIGPFAGGGTNNTGGSNSSDKPGTRQSVILGSFAAAGGSPQQSVVIGTAAAANSSDKGSVLIGFNACPSIFDGSSNIMIGTGVDAFLSNTRNAIAIGSINTKVTTDSISVGDTITNSRHRSLLMGFTLDADADNTVMLGYSNKLQSVKLFKDPLSYAFTANVLTDAFDKFAINKINYTNTLISPDGSNIYDTARSWYYCETVENSESVPATVYTSPTGLYDLTSVTPEFALTQGGFLGLGIGTWDSELCNMRMPAGFPSMLSSNVSSYILASNTGLTYSPLINPLLDLNLNISSNTSRDLATALIGVHDRNFPIAFCNVSLPAVNILDFNASNTMINVNIIKRLATPQLANQSVFLSNSNIVSSFGISGEGMIGRATACNVTFDPSQGIVPQTCNMEYFVTRAPHIGQLGGFKYTPASWCNLQYSLKPELLFLNGTDSFEVAPALRVFDDAITPDTPSIITVNLQAPAPSAYNISYDAITECNQTWTVDYPVLSNEVLFPTSSKNLVDYSYTWPYPSDFSDCFISKHPQHGILSLTGSGIEYRGYNPFSEVDSFHVVLVNSNGESINVTRSVRLDETTRLLPVDIPVCGPSNNTYRQNIVRFPATERAPPVILCNQEYLQVAGSYTSSNVVPPSNTTCWTSNVTESNINFPIEGESNTLYTEELYTEIGLDGSVSSNSYSNSNIQHAYAMSWPAYETSNIRHVSATLRVNTGANVDIVRTNVFNRSLQYFSPTNPVRTYSTRSNIEVTTLRFPISGESNLWNCNVFNVMSYPHEPVAIGAAAYSNFYNARLVEPPSAEYTHNSNIYYIYSSNEHSSNFYDFVTQSYMYETHSNIAPVYVRQEQVPVSQALRYTYNSNILTQTFTDCWRSFAPITTYNIFKTAYERFAVTPSHASIFTVLSNVGRCNIWSTDDVDAGRVFIAGDSQVLDFGIYLDAQGVPGRRMLPGKCIPCATLEVKEGNPRTVSINSNNQLGDLVPIIQSVIDQPLVVGFEPTHVHVYRSAPGFVVSAATSNITVRLEKNTEDPLLLASSRYPGQDIYYFYSSNNFRIGSPVVKRTLGVNQDPFPSGVDFNVSAVNSTNAKTLASPAFYHSRGGLDNSLTATLSNNSTGILNAASFTINAVRAGTVSTKYTKADLLSGNFNSVMNYTINGEQYTYPIRLFNYDGFPLQEQLNDPSIQFINVGNAPLSNALKGTALWGGRSPADYKLVIDRDNSVSPGVFRIEPSSNLVTSAYLQDFVQSKVHFIPFEATGTSNASIKARLQHVPTDSVSPAYTIAAANYFAPFPLASNLRSRYQVPLSDGLVADGYQWHSNETTGMYALSNQVNGNTLFRGIWPNDTTSMMGVEPYVSIIQANLTVVVDQANSISLVSLKDCVHRESNKHAQVYFYVSQNPRFGVLSKNRFTYDELSMATSVSYRHRGASVATDTFYVAVSSTPYNLTNQTIKVTVNVKALPTINYSRTKYVYFNSLEDATNCNIKLTTDDINTSPGGYIIIQNSSNLLGSSNLSSESGAGISNLQLRIDPTILSNQEPPYHPITFEYFTSGSNAIANRTLTDYPIYRDIFIKKYQIKVNDYVAINTPVATTEPLQRIDYIIDPDATDEAAIIRSDRAVNFSFQVRPSWDLNGTDTRALDYLRTLSFTLKLQSFDRSIYTASSNIATQDNIVITINQTDARSEIIVNSSAPMPLPTRLQVGTTTSWNKIAFVNNKYNNATRKFEFKIFVQGVEVYTGLARDFSSLYRISIETEPLDEINLKYNGSSTLYSNISVPGGTLKASLAVRNFRTIYDFKDANIDVTTYARGDETYDVNTHNIVVGKNISVKGIGNLCLGNSFSTTGKDNIILGNSVGVTDDLNTNNEVYQSIVIGNRNFKNSTVSDIICIGNENYAGLEYYPSQLAVRNFMSKKPIIIGNSITSERIPFHINIGDVFMKTDVPKGQVYLGLGGESVMIGYSCNVGGNAAQEGYVLDVNGAVHVRSIRIDEGNLGVDVFSAPELRAERGVFSSRIVTQNFTLNGNLQGSITGGSVVSAFGVYGCNVYASNLVLQGSNASLIACNIYTSQVAIVPGGYLTSGLIAVDKIATQPNNIEKLLDCSGSRLSNVSNITVFGDISTTDGKLIAKQFGTVSTGALDMGANQLSNIQSINIATNATVNGSVITNSFDTPFGSVFNFNSKQLSNITSLSVIGDASIRGRLLTSNISTGSSGIPINFSGTTLSNVGEMYTGRCVTNTLHTQSGASFDFSGNSVSNISSVQCVVIETGTITTLSSIGQLNLSGKGLSNVSGITLSSATGSIVGNVFNTIGGGNGTFNFSAQGISNVRELNASSVILGTGIINVGPGVSDINLSGKNVSNVANITVGGRVIANTLDSGSSSYFNMSGKGMCNLRDMTLSDTLSTKSLIVNTSINVDGFLSTPVLISGNMPSFNLSGKGLSNVSNINLNGYLATDTITTMTGVNYINFSGKTLSNVGTIQASSITTISGNDFDFSGKTLSNVASLQSDVVVTNTFSNVRGNTINFSGQTLSNVSALRASIVNTRTLSNVDGSDIDFSGQTLSNVGFVKSRGNILEVYQDSSVIGTLQPNRFVRIAGLTTVNNTPYVTVTTTTNSLDTSNVIGVIKNNYGAGRMDIQTSGIVSIDVINDSSSGTITVVPNSIIKASVRGEGLGTLGAMTDNIIVARALETVGSIGISTAVPVICLVNM